MADTAISGLTAYSAQSGDDLEEIVDVSDTTMAASGTNKKATTKQKFGSPGSGQVIYWNGASPGVPAGAANLTVGSAGQLNLGSITAPASPANGDMWHDSTQQALAVQRTGITLYTAGLVYSQATAVTATAAASTSLVSTTGATGTVSLPANFLNVSGRTLKIKAAGYYTIPASTAGSFSIAFNLGTNTFATTPTTNFNASAKTNLPWWIDLTVTVASTGASGTLNSGGAIGANGGFVNTSFIGFGNGTTPGTSAPQTPVTIDLTAAYTFDMQITMSASVNSFTLNNLTLEVLG